MNFTDFACLQCQNQSLQVSSNQLICSTCQAHYPLKDGIPLLLPAEKLSLATGKAPITMDVVQETYDRAYHEDGIMGTDLDKTYDRVTKTILLDFARPLEGKRLLDLGTGIGNLWNYVPEGVTGYALDLSLVGVSKALQKHPHLTGSVSVGEHLPYPENFFDIVLSADAIEHAFSPEKVLQEIYRVLKPGGVFSASFPIPDSLHNWGKNQVIKHNFNLGFLFNLGRVLLKRLWLFKTLTFQLIDRDLPLSEWLEMINQSGFELQEQIQWPLEPETPIVYLVHARK